MVHEAGVGLDAVHVGDVEPAGSADPAKRSVEQDQPHQSEPERRAGIAEQPDDAGDVVDDAAAIHRRQHAERHADADADDDGEGGELDGGRKHLHQVVGDPVAGEQRVAEIA